MGIQRGCGSRVSGGIYSCCALSNWGSPVENFIFDPPQIIDPDALGISPIGVELIERDGVWHVLDWIGSRHYPNAADFIEEVRRLGMSRRLRRNLDLSKLGPDSYHLLIHSPGYINAFYDYYSAREGVTRLWDAPRRGRADFRCPKEYAARFLAPESRQGREAEQTARDHYGWLRSDDDVGPLSRGSIIGMCAGLWWEDIEGGTPLKDVTDQAIDNARGEEDRRVVRAQPEFNYAGLRAIDGAATSYAPALIARFPIEQLEVVRNDDDPEDQAKAEAAASRSGLPYELKED